VYQINNGSKHHHSASKWAIGGSSLFYLSNSKVPLRMEVRGICPKKLIPLSVPYNSLESLFLSICMGS